MANVTTNFLTLQSVSSLSGNYPSAADGAAGWDEVTVNYGDNVIIPVVRSSAVNSGYGPAGNNSTLGTLAVLGSFSSTVTTVSVSVTNVLIDGFINIWCEPSNGGSTYGYRVRVKVNVVQDTSITLNNTSVSLSSSDTSYTQGLTNGGTGTLYYIFNVNNIANGSSLDGLRVSGDSRYVGRSWSGNTSKPFSTADPSSPSVSALIDTDLPAAGATKTYYLYSANIYAQNSTLLSTTYTASRPSASVAVPPTLGVTAGIITNGYGMYSNPTGSTTGTVTYRWSTTGGGSGPQSSTNTNYGWQTGTANLGEDALVGNEWVGTSWSVQARATVDNGATYVYSASSSITLPEYTVTAPTGSHQEGSPITFTVSGTNSLGPIYYEVTTASTNDFAAYYSKGQITNFSTTTGTGSFTVTPDSDSVTEGSETATVKIYLNALYNTSNYAHAEDTFTIIDPVGGGQSGGSTPTGTYGLELIDTNGTTTVVGPGIRNGAVIGYASTTLTENTADSYPSFIDFPMNMTGISASTVQTILVSSGFTTAGYADSQFQFLSDRIRFQLPSSAGNNLFTFTGVIMIVRF